MRNLINMRSLVRARDVFRWKCKDGRVMTIGEMDTKHLFNCMKMCFNHLAEKHGGRPVMFTRRYRDYALHAVNSPEQLAATVVMLMFEIERRQDLPAEFKAPYEEILSQIAPLGIEEAQCGLSPSTTC